jgi:hypothetical protein
METSEDFPMGEKDKEVLKVNFDAVSKGLSRMKSEMPLLKSLQDLSTLLDAMPIALLLKPEKGVIYELWDKIEGAIADKSWQNAAREGEMLGNAETTADVLKLLKTADSHMVDCRGSPQVVETTVKGIAHVRLSWRHQGMTVRSRTFVSHTKHSRLRETSIINAHGFFRDFRPNTTELWKSLDIIRKGRSYQAEGVGHIHDFDERSINTVRNTVETCLKSQIALQSAPILQISVDERRGIVAGPRDSVNRIIHMSLEESEVVARCLNNVLPIMGLLWDDVGIVRLESTTSVTQELIKWRQKAHEGKALHRLANFKRGTTEPSRGSRVMDFRVLWSLSIKMAKLASTDKTRAGSMSLQRYICGWVERKAFEPARADELFETLFEGLTTIINLGASSSTSPGLSINIAAFQSPRHHSHVKTFYMLSCTGSIPTKTARTIRTPTDISSKVSHDGSVLYLDARDSSWDSEIASFTQANVRRMRGVGSRLYSLCSQLEASKIQLDAERGKQTMHYDKLSRITSTMGSTLKQEQKVPQSISEKEAPITALSGSRIGAKSNKLSAMVQRSVDKRAMVAPLSSTAPPTSLSNYRFVPAFAA